MSRKSLVIIGALVFLLIVGSVGAFFALRQTESQLAHLIEELQAALPPGQSLEYERLSLDLMGNGITLRGVRYFDEAADREVTARSVFLTPSVVRNDQAEAVDLTARGVLISRGPDISDDIWSSWRVHSVSLKSLEVGRWRTFAVGDGSQADPREDADSDWWNTVATGPIELTKVVGENLYDLEQTISADALQIERVRAGFLEEVSVSGVSDTLFTEGALFNHLSIETLDTNDLMALLRAMATDDDRILLSEDFWTEFHLGPFWLLELKIQARYGREWHLPIVSTSGIENGRIDQINVDLATMSDATSAPQFGFGTLRVRGLDVPAWLVDQTVAPLNFGYLGIDDAVMEDAYRQIATNRKPITIKRFSLDHRGDNATKATRESSEAISGETAVKIEGLSIPLSGSRSPVANLLLANGTDVLNIEIEWRHRYDRRADTAIIDPIRVDLGPVGHASGQLVLSALNRGVGRYAEGDFAFRFGSAMIDALSLTIHHGVPMQPLIDEMASRYCLTAQASSSEPCGSTSSDQVFPHADEPDADVGTLVDVIESPGTLRIDVQNRGDGLTMDDFSDALFQTPAAVRDSYDIDVAPVR